LALFRMNTHHRGTEHTEKEIDVVPVKEFRIASVVSVSLW